MRELDGHAEADFDPPFEVIEPTGFRAPVVLNSPHSGAIYPADFLRASRLDALTLRRSEDAFVDELYLPSIDLGAPLLRARFPRAFLDLNREPFELDPQMFDGRLPDFANTRSLRVAAGLGVIPRVVGEAQPIYRGVLSVGQALSRIDRLYRPYHAQLNELLETARAEFGLGILIDCHSMPSTSADVGGCDVVLGDRFGSSAAPWIVDVVEQSLRASGFVVRRNKPYAGGFITEHYGAPQYGRHAVQVEINRALYMDERSIRKLDSFGAVAAALGTMTRDLVDRAHGLRTTRLAAE